MSTETASPEGTQAIILEAAERLFTRFGFAKVTMDEIAEGAGLKKPSLYYYYANKEELFRSVVDKKRAGFKACVSKILDRKETAAARLEQFVSVRFEYFKNLQELNILDFKQATHNLPALVQMFRQHAAEEIAWIADLIDRGNHAGEFHVKEPHEVAEMFQHVLRGLRLRVIRQSESIRPTSEALSRLHREMTLFTGIFLAGISKPTSMESEK